MKAKGHSKAIPALLRLEMSEEDPGVQEDVACI